MWLSRSAVVGEGFGRSRPPAAHELACDVARDAAQPRREKARSGSYWSGRVMKNTNVSGSHPPRRGPRVQEGEPVHRILMAAIQLDEGVFVSLFHAREQRELGLQVLWGHGHGSFVTPIAGTGGKSSNVPKGRLKVRTRYRLGNEDPVEGDQHARRRAPDESFSDGITAQ
jgi:hypothetical protein